MIGHIRLVPLQTARFE